VLNKLLLAGVADAPDKALVVTAARTATYRDVATRAAALATGLDERGITRFGCLVDDVAELIALLAASSALSAEACMYPRSASGDEAARLAAHFDHEVIITDRADREGALALESLAADPATDQIERQPEHAPLLILTTGTTGLPKGARNDWVRLVRTHEKRVGPSDASWLMAHVPNQFAGLGVLLHCMASGATLVVPTDYEPRAALTAMRDHGVTHVSATPTFWRFLLNFVLRDDAGDLALRQITLAGEAVPSALLGDLERAFPNANISQIYGATEFGSSVAVGDGRNGMPARVLERGDDAEVQFRIVDGELHVRSRIGMLGYYGDDDVGDSWRPTGDLVEVRDERIFFVGRSTETINVGGVKVHPLPIEDIISAVPGVDLAHVYGRSSPVAGQIVAVDIVAAPNTDREAIEAAARSACSELAPAAQPRLIRFVESLTIRDTKIARREPEPS
jgi:acyl-CoA synthetase (AMP-forming)/AMP-acid ligase II